MHADAQLSLACDEISTIVIADATQIEQILLNLVINALDAMPAGGTVTVTTTAVTLLQPLLTRTGQIPPGEYVELSVSDTGTGMDAATLDRIFEPFFTTKPRGKGTGLGLATVLGIARELRGGVDLTTAPGAGTTF